MLTLHRGTVAAVVDVVPYVPNVAAVVQYLIWQAPFAIFVTELYSETCLLRMQCRAKCCSEYSHNIVWNFPLFDTDTGQLFLKIFARQICSNLFPRSRSLEFNIDNYSEFFSDEMSYFAVQRVHKYSNNNLRKKIMTKDSYLVSQVLTCPLKLQVIRRFSTYLCDVTIKLGSSPYPGPFLMKYRRLMVSWASRAKYQQRKWHDSPDRKMPP